MPKLILLATLIVASHSRPSGNERNAAKRSFEKRYSDWYDKYNQYLQNNLSPDKRQMGYGSYPGQPMGYGAPAPMGMPYPQPPMGYPGASPYGYPQTMMPGPGMPYGMPSPGGYGAPAQYPYYGGYPASPQMSPYRG